MLKKLVLFVAAVMLLAPSAQAAKNVAAVSGDLSSIYTGTTGQAGKIALTIDSDTALNSTRNVRFTLPGDGHVVLARNYNLMVRLDKGGATNDTISNATGVFVGEANVTRASGITEGYLNLNGTKGQDFFVLSVTAGAELLANATQQLKITLFDGLNAEGDWTYGNGTVAAAEDTALCITVKDSYKDKYVSLALKTPEDGSFSFAPTSTNIAELKAKSISLVDMKAEPVHEVGDGQKGGCSVDYEVNKYCNVNWSAATNGYVALHNGAAWPEGIYEITAEIVVDGAVGAKGAYFADAIDQIEFVKEKSGLRNAFTGAALATGSKKLYLANGRMAAGGADNCLPADDKKVTRVVSTTNAAVGPAHVVNNFLRFDIPTIWLVKQELPANAKIGVKITVAQGCGQFASVVFEKLFTAVDECPLGDQTPAGSLLFPYFADAPYWNGMALTNIGLTEVNASLLIVDAKGGEGTIDVVVPAKGMYVNLVEKIVADSAFNGTVNPKERCYIMVKPRSGSLTGFAMMGNAGESMGYTVNNN